MIVGIDYSMSSPAICVCNGEFKYENCKFLFVTSTKKYAQPFNNQIEGKPLFEYKNNVDRFAMLAELTYEFIFDNWPEGEESSDVKIGLEGYAMGAKGQVFNIGENTGVLKHRLSYTEDWEIDIHSPSSIKKFATGKGNAKKEDMYASFVEETGVNLSDILEQSVDPKVSSPISDIVDAFYIAKLQSTM
ncbi:MAG: hypothetical protein H8D23_02975 [Candidatus Brocadiales bacterium]|nr:hypothetical protein [Candidatus Brocadiales bacterium]